MTVRDVKYNILLPIGEFLHLRVSKKFDPWEWVLMLLWGVYPVAVSVFSLTAGIYAALAMIVGVFAWEVSKWAFPQWEGEPLEVVIVALLSLILPVLALAAGFLGVFAVSQLGVVWLYAVAILVPEGCD